MFAESIMHGGTAAPRKSEKIRNFKNEAHFGGLWGKCFRGNGPGRESILGESNVYRSVQTRPAHIVHFRRQGAGRGGLSKNSALPQAKIWGHTPILTSRFAGMPKPYKSWKNGEKISARFRDMNFRKFGENSTFLE